MSEKAAAAVAEAPAKSGNITVEQLGAMMNKTRKGAGSSTPTGTEPPINAAAASEQAATDESTTQPQTELEAAATNQETETEQSETPSPEAHSSDEEQQQQEAEERPKSKAVRDLQARVDKVTAQREAERNARLEAERQLAEVKAQLEQAPAPQSQNQPAAQLNEQFAGDAEVVQLDKTLSDIETFLDFAARHPDGGSFEDGGKTYELDADQMRAFKTKSERERVRLSSKREARLESARQSFNAKRAEAHTEAVKLYPWIEQKSSPEFQAAITLIRENPGVMNHADFELIVARQVAGQRLETEARKKLGSAPKSGQQSQRMAAPVVTHSPSAAPKATARDKQVQAVEGQFQKTGKVADLQNLLAERRRARMQPA